MPFYKSLALFAILVSMSASNPISASCQSVPDSITLNQSGKLYQPFAFNHAKHIEQIKECADCHHHTAGTLNQDANCIRCHKNSSATSVVACKGCHSPAPFSPETLADKAAHPQRIHLDKMGLKGAMHQSCMGCHQKMGKGPVGCQDCHKRSAEGNALYSAEVVPKKGGKKHHE